MLSANRFMLSENLKQIFLGDKGLKVNLPENAKAWLIQCQILAYDKNNFINENDQLLNNISNSMVDES